MNLKSLVAISAFILLSVMLGAPLAASAIDVVPASALSPSPLDPLGPPEPPVIGAVQGAGCQPFIITGGSFGIVYPQYSNGAAGLGIAWSLPDAEIGEWVTLWLDDNLTGGVELVESSAEGAFIDVLTSDFDDEPPGYALNPGLHTLHATMEQNGVICGQAANFIALPPPIDVEAENAPFWEYPTRTETLTFKQKFKVDEPVTDYYAMHAELFTADFGFFSFSFGSTATAGEDFDGPVTVYPSLNPVIFPAGSQSVDVDITIIDDLCPERTEYISIHAIYEVDLQWAGIIWMAPEWRFNIIDDDDFRRCIPTSKF